MTHVSEPREMQVGLLILYYAYILLTDFSNIYLSYLSDVVYSYHIL